MVVNVHILLLVEVNIGNGNHYFVSAIKNLKQDDQSSRNLERVQLVTMQLDMIHSNDIQN